MAKINLVNCTNSSFNSIEFDGIKNQAGINSFSLTPKRWIEATNAIGIIKATKFYIFHSNDFPSH